jgi:tetratricopeptide (TPR) repeat protein
MADANELKIQARREEAAGDYEQASRLYLEALSAMDEGGNLSDPSLLVRVADLEYRQDDRESALDYYLQAVDEYADQGLITNAIAVCNKILRVFPDQVDCHRRLADLHMAVGLTAEARQNLLRFADEAWDPEAPERVLEAMRSFLDRTPDQEVALEYASRLQEAGRDREAIDALESVWEERTRAGADVEALKRKAEEIHSGATVASWSRETEDEGTGEGAAEETAGAGEDALEPAADGEPARVDVGEELSGRRPAASATADSDPPADAAPADAGGPAGHEPAAELAAERGLDNGGDVWSREPNGRRSAEQEQGREFARGGVPAAPERELELVASYRERFIEVHRPPEGRGPAPSNGAAGPADRPGAVAGEAPSAEVEETTRSPTPQPLDAAGGDAGTRSETREEEIMEELDELGRADDVDEAAGASDGSGWDEDDLPTLDDEPDGPDAGFGGGGSPADGGAGLDDRPEQASRPERPGPTAGDGPDGGLGAGNPSMPSGDEELGEEAELRRGLDLVDEMLEVQPDNLELRERKLRYARRLGDRETLVRASLEFADALAKDGARRSARALYRRALELDPENQAAESGLARLDVGELEEKRQSGKRAGATHATPEAASPEEQEARRELGMRLWTEFENSIREMPWLHAATQAYQSTGPDALPPLETFEMLAHYLVARGRYRDAAEILERALGLSGEGDEEAADILYYLGRAHEMLGEDDRAGEYYERLERVDPDFARVSATLGDDAPDPRS